MTTPTPTAIVADDERLMRDQLITRLKVAWPELAIVGEAVNGRDAVALARSLAPDFAFLDIRMPEVDGLQAATLLSGHTHVVFVTAYDEYAVRAFDEGAVDYLLKPVDPERLARTCQRLRDRLRQAPQPMDSLLRELSERLGTGAIAPPAHLRWIQASVGSSIRMIPTSDVLFFRAEDKYTRVQAMGFEALIRKPIKELLEELDPNEFWQIHRSTVVRVDAIAQVTRSFSGKQLVQLRGCDEKLEVSRGFSHLFRQM